jgi:hypothetical protein
LRLESQLHGDFTDLGQLLGYSRGDSARGNGVDL